MWELRHESKRYLWFNEEADSKCLLCYEELPGMGNAKGFLIKRKIAPFPCSIARPTWLPQLEVEKARDPGKGSLLVAGSPA
jgi:hypothetical protein